VLPRGAIRDANCRRTGRLRATPAVGSDTVVAGRGVVRCCPPLLHPSGRRFEPCRAHRFDQDIGNALTCGSVSVVSNVVRTRPSVRRMPGPRRRRKRAQGSIQELPSGALRVAVYAGIDPLTGRRLYLRPRAASPASTASGSTCALRRSPDRQAGQSCRARPIPTDTGLGAGIAVDAAARSPGHSSPRAARDLDVLQDAGRGDGLPTFADGLGAARITEAVVAPV
jgi:hypothetical protein